MPTPGCLASLDLVEYNPMLDVRGQTAELLLDLLQSLFGKSTLSRPHSPAKPTPPAAPS